MRISTRYRGDHWHANESTRLCILWNGYGNRTIRTDLHIGWRAWSRGERGSRWHIDSLAIVGEDWRQGRDLFARARLNRAVDRYRSRGRRILRCGRALDDERYVDSFRRAIWVGHNHRDVVGTRLLPAWDLHMDLTGLRVDGLRRERILVPKCKRRSSRERRTGRFLRCRNIVHVVWFHSCIGDVDRLVDINVVCCARHCRVTDADRSVDDILGTIWVLHNDRNNVVTWRNISPRLDSDGSIRIHRCPFRCILPLREGCAATRHGTILPNGRSCDWFTTGIHRGCWVGGMVTGVVRLHTRCGCSRVGYFNRNRDVVLQTIRVGHDHRHVVRARSHTFWWVRDYRPFWGDCRP